MLKIYPEQRDQKIKCTKREMVSEMRGSRPNKNLFCLQDTELDTPKQLPDKTEKQ